MVEHSRKFNFRFKDKKIVISKLAHEPEFMPYAKALVYALFHTTYQTLRVEAKFEEARFQPDLSAQGYDGTVLFWAEVGNVSLSKIEKLFKKYRQAHFVFVREERDIPAFEKNLDRMAKGMASLPLVEIIVYPEHFHEWNVSEEGDVYVNKEDVKIIRWNEPDNLKKYY